MLIDAVAYRTKGILFSFSQDHIFTTHLHKMENTLNSSSAEDSDNDLITDFLNSNCTEQKDLITKKNQPETNGIQTNAYEQKIYSNKDTTDVKKLCIPIINAPTVVLNNYSNNNNMIPTINVTPHSPASKYNNIFEDTLNQLQNIRESVVQMKNSTIHMQEYLPNYGLMNTAILSASLPDLSGNNSNSGGVTGGTHFIMWSSQQQNLLNTDRRKSWTANDDLAAGDGTNKSISLSSLDSEEQETIRVTEQRRRSARNSTGGISTHSLNEAELARDFERIAAKRNLTTEIISRIPLQKSISTSSIIAKEDNKIIGRHLTDSEDENQSLLRAHAKIEVYDNSEKRRKRGSLFFRKKKDKVKIKGQSISCDACGTTVNLSTVKDHQLECRGKKHNVKTPSNKKVSNDKNEAGQDMYDGTDQGTNNFNDDTPLIRAEYLNDPPIVAQDLGADPTLGIALKEHDSWSPSVPKEVLKSLTEKQIKRQEHIYEFIMTEKHHCQTLLVMQKVFVESLERHFPALNVNQMFPRLTELTELHTTFLKRLRQKQRENYKVDSIADILLEFFSLERAQNLRLAYGEFCANHRTALEEFKFCITSRDQSFAEWYKHCLTNPLLKKKGIPECILFVTQRLTKYPLLIDPLLKSAGDDKLESDKLQHALNLVKALLVDVDACVAEKELKERQIEIFNRIDVKSFAIYKNKPFRKSDVGVASRRRLKFEGVATLMQGRSKMQIVLVVVLTDCLCFLSENSAHNKYTLFTPEHKAGVVPLQKLLIREKAGTESRGIYIISSNPSFPEMYELKVQQPKDKNVWIQSIRQAVLECPSSDILETEDLTAEEKLKIGVNKRELIEKMRQKDIEQALILEEKIILQLNLLREQKNFSEPACIVSAANFLSTFGSYKDLVNVDCDTVELWKRVLNTVQDISQLATSVYTAATGLPVSRSVSSVGEKQSEAYSSPTLPKRAETFAGFDEKRSKNVFPCRDVAKLTTTQMMSPRLQELEEKREERTPQEEQTRLLIQEQTRDSKLSVQATDELPLKEHSFAALQVSHNLHTLLCIISQQMTTIHSLQLQLALYRESPKTVYTHNDQLEELRNLQDKLQEEKTAWLRQKESQEQDLEEQRIQQSNMNEKIKAEQDDIKQQREQLYRKMELLSSQGLLLSPNTPLMIVNPSLSTSNNDDTQDGASDGHNHAGTNVEANSSALGSVDRRKERWRTASTISKTPPGNLLSATNAPKVNPTSVKQKIPMKLSSISSSKIDKSASFNNSTTSTVSHLNTSPSSTGVTQMLPLKLADKRSTHTTHQIIPQHSRTGSSPAIIQHPTTVASSPTSTPVSRTDSASTFTFGQKSFKTPRSARNPDFNSSKNSSSPPFTTTTATTTSSYSSSRIPKAKPEEEEIYF